MLLSSLGVLVGVAIISLFVLQIILVSRVNCLEDDIKKLEIRNNDNSKVINIVLSEVNKLSDRVEELDKSIDIIEDSLVDNIKFIHEEIEVLENTIESVLDAENRQNENISLLLEEANSNIDVLSEVTEISLTEINNEIEEVKKQIMTLHDIENEEPNKTEEESRADMITRLAKIFIDLE